jgi:hypothetical protein
MTRRMVLIGVLLLSLGAAPPNASRRAEPTLDEKCQATVKELRKSLGADAPIVVRAPFVISGDLSKKDLEAWHARTLKPATDAMLASYFDRQPDEPITVLLYDTAETYDAEAKRLFGDEKLSPYGYYKPARRTLVMNISTGGGTLVHELTHALIDFDFPDVPDWFNEGLASLHEQCRFREDGSGIDGLENWRLPALQEAIRDGKLRSLESLILGDDFRGRRMGLNYAQARYFCLYLQRLDLLESYYEAFRDNQEKDPTGALAVRTVFPEKSWAELDRDFQAWVLELEAP